MSETPSSPRQTLTGAQVFDKALAAAAAGRTQEAERLYRLLLEATPMP